MVNAALQWYWTSGKRGALSGSWRTRRKEPVGGDAAWHWTLSLGMIAVFVIPELIGGLSGGFQWWCRSLQGSSKAWASW